MRMLGTRYRELSCMHATELHQRYAVSKPLFELINLCLCKRKPHSTEIFYNRTEIPQEAERIYNEIRTKCGRRTRYKYFLLTMGAHHVQRTCLVSFSEASSLVFSLVRGHVKLWKDSRRERREKRR